MTETELSDLLQSILASDLSPGTQESVESLILDTVGCAIFGTKLPWVQDAATAVQKWNPPIGSGAPRIGTSDRFTPALSAFLNSTAAHGFDLDDLHFPTMTHPGAVVIPAAIAATFEQDVTGACFEKAVVAGYEAMIRVAFAIGLEPGERGFHATSICGPIGAAVAATSILGGDGAAIENAVGIAASFGAGIKAFQHGPGAIKRIQVGRAAEAGMQAANLAMEGVEGPRDALTGRFGFVRVYRPRESRDQPISFGEADEKLGVDEMYIKPFAACGALHGLMRAASEIAEEPRFTLEAVSDIILGCPNRVLEQNNIPAPTDSLTAQYSAQFAVAVGLSGLANDPVQFLDASLKHYESLVRRTVLILDEDAQEAYPSSNEGRVTVRLNDGSELVAYGTVTADSNQGWNVAAEKFEALATSVLSSDAATSILESIHELALAQSTVRRIFEPFPR